MSKIHIQNKCDTVSTACNCFHVCLIDITRQEHTIGTRLTNTMSQHTTYIVLNGVSDDNESADN